MNKAVILDTETTGLAHAEPIEIAWLELESPTDTKVKHVYHQLFRPKGKISYGAMAVHHIHPHNLDDKPEFNGNCGLNSGDYIIGHNIDFDVNVIGNPDVKRICTLAISRYLFPDNEGHSLGAMMYRMYDDADYVRHLRAEASFEALAERLTNAHSAYYDCFFNKELLDYILYKMADKPNNWEELYHYSEMARIPTVMPFGKHKGTLIADMPMSYCSWAIKQDDMDKYIKKAILRDHPVLKRTI